MEMTITPGYWQYHNGEWYCYNSDHSRITSREAQCPICKTELFYPFTEYTEFHNGVTFRYHHKPCNQFFNFIKPT